MGCAVDNYDGDVTILLVAIHQKNNQFNCYLIENRTNHLTENISQHQQYSENIIYTGVKALIEGKVNRSLDKRMTNPDVRIWTGLCERFL